MSLELPPLVRSNVCLVIFFTSLREAKKLFFVAIFTPFPKEGNHDYVAQSAIIRDFTVPM